MTASGELEVCLFEQLSCHITQTTASHHKAQEGRITQRMLADYQLMRIGSTNYHAGLSDHHDRAL